MVEGEDLEATRKALGELGATASVALKEVGAISHLLTHRRLEVTVTRAQVRRAHRLRSKLAPPYVALRWARPDEVALSTLARRVLSAADQPQESLF